MNEIATTLTPEQIINKFLPLMGWSTSKADDGHVLGLPATDLFSVVACKGDGEQVSELRLLNSRKDTMIVYTVETRNIEGQQCRFASAEIYEGRLGTSHER